MQTVWSGNQSLPRWVMRNWESMITCNSIACHLLPWHYVCGWIPPNSLIDKTSDENKTKTEIRSPPFSLSALWEQPSIRPVHQAIKSNISVLSVYRSLISSSRMFHPVQSIHTQIVTHGSIERENIHFCLYIFIYYLLHMLQDAQVGIQVFVSKPLKNHNTNITVWATLSAWKRIAWN